MVGGGVRRRRAARRLGAADALRSVIGTTVRPVDRRIHEQTVAAARAALGAAAFDVAFAEGRSGAVEDAVAAPSARGARET
jgi:phosphoribosylformimino-5-aminoimidazole carboxamide ribonucleotide (ProFAR) isomerase